MLFPQSSAMLTEQGVEVSANGEIVRLEIGGTPIDLHYEHAFALSRWMRSDAGLAKQMDGGAKTARSLGVLTDGSKKRAAPRADGVSIHVKSKLQTFNRDDVGTDGKLIRVKIGLHTIHLPYETALTISQWIRVRAKECRNNAGDVRHWSDIGTDDA